MTNLVCRICKGNHLTIKCGKKKENKVCLNNKLNKSVICNKIKPKKNFRTYTVKIENLPDDITIDELYKLTNE